MPAKPALPAASLDTSVLIAAERNQPGLAEWLATLGELHVCPVALAEWCFGAAAVKDAGKRARAEKFYQAFLRRLPVPALTEADALAYGAAVGELARHGQTVDLADGLIALHARARGWAVVTLNPAHFEPVPDLEVLTPATGRKNPA